MSEDQAKSIPLPKIKRGGRAFLPGVKRELKKVSWPTIKETNRLFGVVLAVCLLLIVVMAVIGTFADEAIAFLIGSGGK